MTIFGAIVRTVVNVATLPIAVAKDVVFVMADAGDGDSPGRRTVAKLEQIKDEADADGGARG